MMRHCLLWALFLFGMAGVEARSPVGDDAAKKDLAQMQGVWNVTELVEKGEKLPAKDLTPVKVVILASKMTLTDDGVFREEITLKFNAAQKIRAVDFVYTKGPNVGKSELGIYEINGDTIKFCVNETKDGARPVAFVSTKNNGCSVAVLQRVKK
jgi:uncharacterized protein (TIGR03067 family)